MNTIGNEGNGRNLPLFNAINSSGMRGENFVNSPAKEDYSHGSSYWDDKKYGHEAPDGTVHPQRYADRKREREEYAKSKNN
jgi:hypothetical protein